MKPLLLRHQCVGWGWLSHCIFTYFSMWTSWKYYVFSAKLCDLGHTMHSGFEMRIRFWLVCSLVAWQHWSVCSGWIPAPAYCDCFSGCDSPDGWRLLSPLLELHIAANTDDCSGGPRSESDKYSHLNITCHLLLLLFNYKHRSRCLVSVTEQSFSPTVFT